MVWYSFTLIWGFLGTNIHPWQVNLLFHIEMDSSKQDKHEGMNTSFVCWFNTTIVWKTSNNSPLNMEAEYQ